MPFVSEQEARNIVLLIIDVLFALIGFAVALTHAFVIERLVSFCARELIHLSAVHPCVGVSFTNKCLSLAARQSSSDEELRRHPCCVRFVPLYIACVLAPSGVT